MGSITRVMMVAITLVFSVAGLAADVYDYNGPLKNDVWSKQLKNQFNSNFGKVNYDEERIVLTATVLNKKKPAQDTLYGGSFSPTAAAYLKPFKSSQVRTFVQATCLDYYCNYVLFSVGVKTKLGNPYAFVEEKFVLSKLKNIMPN